MVKFLLEKGADLEHKTDEMHTALMEASMDGHVDVARLLLDHGAQVCSCYVVEFLYYGVPFIIVLVGLKWLMLRAMTL
jgi:ankyrin repeat protein